MERLKQVLRQPGFQMMGAILFFLLFNWPLFTIASAKPGTGVPIYLFVVWGCLIIGLFFVSRSLSQEDGVN